MSQRLLYVEDDPVQALVVGELLAALGGMECIVEETAAAARDRATAWAPDLLLLDHELPDGSGPELLCELRQQGVNAPALLLTAHRLPQAPEGFSGMLSKPLDFAAFRAAIQQFKPAAAPGP